MNGCRWCVAAVAAAAALVVGAPTATAQYMYLDTNSDSLHTDADVLAPTGTTTVSVWIRTDANRDGTPVTCAYGAGPLDIMSYEFVLRAIDGTVTWITFENNPPNSLPLHQLSSPTDFVSGLCLVPRTGPGRVRLATLTVEVASGTPSLLVVPTSPLTTHQYTAFGSACASLGEDNTMALGVEWFDTDGIRYGGWTTPPTLVQPAAMTVAENSTAEQTVTVTNPGGGEVEVQSAGPAYMTLLREGSGPASTWKIHLAPGFSDSGMAIGQLVASGGTGKDFRSFAIHVLNTNRAPVLSLASSLCLEAGASKTLRIRGTDPDDDNLSFTEEGAPDFVTFEGPYRGELVLHAAPPPGQPPGSSTIRITMSDGSLSVLGTIELRVAELGGCSGRAPLVARAAPNPMRADGAILFWTSKPGPLRVTLHDAKGRLLRTLRDERNAPAANYRIAIPIGSRYDPARLTSGIYFYRVEGADGVATGRLVVLRRASMIWDF